MSIDCKHFRKFKDGLIKLQREISNCASGKNDMYTWLSSRGTKRRRATRNGGGWMADEGWRLGRFIQVQTGALGQVGAGAGAGGEDYRRGASSCIIRGQSDDDLGGFNARHGSACQWLGLVGYLGRHG